MMGTSNGLAFSEDGRTLASMGADRMLRYWNPHTEQRQPQSEISPIDRVGDFDPLGNQSRAPHAAYQRFRYEPSGGIFFRALKMRMGC